VYVLSGGVLKVLGLSLEIKQKRSWMDLN